MMKPILAWPGGKAKQAKKIASLMPDHDTYVEPFVGGANVFLNKQPAKREILNDIDPQLTNFYRTIQGKNLNCNLSNWTKKKFDRIARKTTLSPCEFLALNKMSFMAKHTHTKPAVIKRTAHAWHYNEAPHRLAQATILNQDWKPVVQKHDSPTTLHYLDPPYVKTDCSYGGGRFCDVKPEDVCDFAKKARGKVVISYDDVPEVRHACAGLSMKPLTVMQTHSNTRQKELGKTVTRRHELLISNFPLKPRENPKV